MSTRFGTFAEHMAAAGVKLEGERMKIEVSISNIPGSDSKDPGIIVSFASADEAAPNTAFVERAVLWAAGKNNLEPGRCYMWHVRDDEGKRDAGGMVSVGIVAVACEFPRSVTDDDALLGVVVGTP